MLSKMGWSEGKTLGTGGDQGLLEPVRLYLFFARKSFVRLDGMWDVHLAGWLVTSIKIKLG